MAVTIRGVVADDGDNSTSQVTVTLPAGTVSTDLIVLYESSESATSDELPAPTNGTWTQRAYSGSTGTALPQAKIWTRTGLTAGAVITSNQTEASDTHYLCAYVLVGADTSGFLASASSTGTGSATQTAPTLNPTKSGLYIGAFTANGTGDYTGVSGGLTQNAKRTVAGDNAFIAGSKQVAAGSVSGSATHNDATDAWSGASFFVGAAGPTEVAGSDTATFALTDSASVDLKALTGSDTVAFALTDSAVVSVPIQVAGSDTATFALTDAVSVVDRYTVKAGSDTATFALTDSAVRNTIGPTFGTWISPPRALPEDPIGGSLLFWIATLPPGTSLTVETSVDNGASWQPAVNYGPIARLLSGTSVAKSLLVRATMTKTLPEDATPRLHYLEAFTSLDSGRDELCPLGVFTLNDTAVQDGPNGLEIELSGADLARKVSRNRWDNTYVVPEGSNYADAIVAGVTDRLPGATANVESTERTTPRLFFGEQASNDPWTDFQDMATAIGHELFFDAMGIVTLRPEPDPEIDSAVWQFDDDANPTVTNLVRRVSDENTYNKIVVTGEGTSNVVPVRAVAIDDDPASPTYFLGPYGTVTLRVTTPMVTTVEQAQDAADALLRRFKGATEAVEIEVVPMPALEPGDVVTVINGRSKVEGRFLIDALRIPLGAEDTMRIVGRRQRS